MNATHAERDDVPTADTKTDEINVKHTWLLLLSADGREQAKWDEPVCTDCKRGRPVKTNRYQGGHSVFEAHRCTDCGSVGATVFEITTGPRPEKEMKTTGTVRTVNLAADEHAEYRGTL